MADKKSSNIVVKDKVAAPAEVDKTYAVVKEIFSGIAGAVGFCAVIFYIFGFLFYSAFLFKIGAASFVTTLPYSALMFAGFINAFGFILGLAHATIESMKLRAMDEPSQYAYLKKYAGLASIKSITFSVLSLSIAAVVNFCIYHSTVIGAISALAFNIALPIPMFFFGAYFLDIFCEKISTKISKRNPKLQKIKIFHNGFQNVFLMFVFSVILVLANGYLIGMNNSTAEFSDLKVATDSDNDDWVVIALSDSKAYLFRNSDNTTTTKISEVKDLKMRNLTASESTVHKNDPLCPPVPTIPKNTDKKRDCKHEALRHSN